MSSLAAGALPGNAETVLDGVPLRQGLSDNGRPGYDGPGPLPDAARHYIFRVYALDVPGWNCRPASPAPTCCARCTAISSMKRS